MPIETPNVGQVGLGGSNIPTVDTYSRPGFDSSDNDLMQLGKAMQKLGVSFDDWAAQGRAAKDELDKSTVELDATKLRLHVGNVQNDVRAGGPKAVQAGILSPEKSPAVNHLIRQRAGELDADSWINDQIRTLYADPETLADPKAFEAGANRIRAEAVKKFGDDPVRGSGALGVVNKTLEAYSKQFQKRRDGVYEDIAVKGIAYGTQSAIDDAATKAQVTWKTAKQSGNDYSVLRKYSGDKDIDHMQASFADKLQAMFNDAPEEIKDGLKLQSGFRTWERQKALKTKADAGGRGHMVGSEKGSKHTQGWAADIGVVNKSFADTPAGQWIHANAEKYGLYFPLDGKNGKPYEPWHIEDIDSGRKGSASEKESDTDGPDDHGAVQNVADRIMAAENNTGNPNAKNPNSSASGPAQFTDGTWIDAVREFDRSTRGMSDADILKLKSNVEYHKKVAYNWTANNAKKLEANGLPATDGNLYAMHFLGRGGAAKVLKASDGTPMSQVMDPAQAEANPKQARMTVGQFKQWASEAVGGTTDQVTMARNNLRALDSAEGAAGMVKSSIRREVISTTLIKQAEAKRDAGILNNMPPELVTPDIQIAFDEARNKIATARRTEQAHAYQMLQQDRAETLRQGKMEVIAAQGKGDKIDPFKFASSPELFEYATNAMTNEFQIDASQSKRDAGVWANRVQTATVSGDFSGVFDGDASFKGVMPTEMQLMDKVLQLPIRSSDKQALIEKIPTMVGVANVAQSPEVRQFYTDNVQGYGKGFNDRVLARLDSKYGDGVPIDFERIGHDTFNSRMRNGTKAWMEDNPGKGLPKGRDALSIQDDAQSKAKQAVDDAWKQFNESGPAKPAATEKTEAKPAEKKAEAPAKPGKVVFDPTTRTFTIEAGAKPSDASTSETNTGTAKPGPMFAAPGTVKPAAKRRPTIPHMDEAQTLIDTAKTPAKKVETPQDEYQKAVNALIKKE